MHFDFFPAVPATEASGKLRPLMSHRHVPNIVDKYKECQTVITKQKQNAKNVVFREKQSLRSYTGHINAEKDTCFKNF